MLEKILKLLSGIKKNNYDSDEENKKGADEEYWDKLMMWKFNKDILEKQKEGLNGEFMCFDVEY